MNENRPQNSETVMTTNDQTVQAVPTGEKEPVSPTRWLELFKVILVWIVVLGLTLPFFWVVKDRGPEIVESIKARDPRYSRMRADALEARGKLQYQEGQLNRAAFSLQQALRENPRLSEPHYYLGLINRDKGEIDSAMKQLEAALSKDPQLYRARFELARIYENEGKTYQAFENLMILDDMLPEESIFRDEYQIGRYMFPMAQQLLEQDKNHIHALLVLGRNALRREQPREAESYFRRVISRDKKNLPALLGMVKVKKQLGDSQQVVYQLAELVRLFPKQVEYYEMLQTEREQVGELTGGIASGLFRQLEGLAPDYSFRGPQRGGMILNGFDLLSKPTVFLNLKKVQLHWRQVEGLVWESEFARPIYQLHDNLYARDNRLFEIKENNLIPNSGFEFGQSGKFVPSEWKFGFNQEPALESGWLTTIEEELPSLKVNKFLRFDRSKLPKTGSVGAYSVRFRIQSGVNYLFGARIRSRGGNPYVFFIWEDAHAGNPQIKRVFLRPRSTDWEFHHYMVESPLQSVFLYIVIGNLAGSGVVDYDDLFLIKIDEDTPSFINSSF